MVWRKLARIIQQELSQTLILIIGVNIQVVNKIIPHCQERNRTILTLDNKDFILLQHMIAEVIAVFVEEVTFEPLKFRE
jgi:hypothetical protein